MKFLLDNWALILLALTSGGLLLWPKLQQAGGQGVSPNEAVRLMNREKGVLIDVSEPAEFAAGHAGGSVNVPLAQLEGAKALPKNKTLPVILVCPSGRRAARAVAGLRKAGWEQATAVAGGTAAWREAGLPVERTA